MLIRPRRLRINDTLREMIREVDFHPRHLIYPLFVLDKVQAKEPISSMPGCFRYGYENIVKVCEEIYKAGIKAIILFGIPEQKDEYASPAYAENGVVQKTIKNIKKSVPNLLLITDVCLCEYTSHGHCGILKGETVDNDATLPLLVKTAISQVQAGADMVAPSDMMDGRVKAIRQGLDKAGYVDIPIMSYAAKYASAFYGPFREAADSAPSLGHRKGYQMDPGNSTEAIKEIKLDLEEGADIIMVKPALPYLDIIALAHNTFNVPLAAYCVSGEYAMLKAAAAQGWLDEKNTVLETMLSIRRAGATLILTYSALDICCWLAEGNPSILGG